MPRPKKPRLPRPFLRNQIQSHSQSNRHPPGLKGKEIGLFYKYQYKQGINRFQNSRIYLRIPQAVIVGLYKCLEKIEEIARNSNIYIPPAIKLQFVAPAKHSNFIPIHAPDSEKLTHSITNIRKRDDDVIFVKNEGKEEQVIDISDSSSEDNDTKPQPETIAGGTGIFNYASVKPSTSACSNITHKNNPSIDYKYGYEDIITGTFQDKLDECILKGFKITFKDCNINEINESLKENHHHLAENAQYQTMLEFRKTLPTYKKAEELLEVINNNQVVVISGETGCGKSTQVPQLILDDAIAKGRGANVKVLVTEPRRIAASSLAARVSEERGEPLGQSVGYAVRLESVQCRPRASIMFCTTGVLLVELEEDLALGSYSHIILDEVHERDCQVDMSICMLKQILEKRKDLKLILMSATIDADSLSKYYDNCPMVHIEGLAYPVKDVYMEEILELTKFELPYRANFRDYNPPTWNKYIKKHRDVAKEMQKEIQYKAAIASWLKTSKMTMDPKVFSQIEDFRIEELNLELVVDLLHYICKQEPGAILVFLPGISEISKLISVMKDSEVFPSSSHDIYALHSKLPTIDQNKIFKRPPSGVRKIIIATNIAETSITIDDIVYVIDCGKMKYKGLHVDKNITTLQVEWISKANLRQRRGRAGRCQPGICYHLLTTYRAEILPDRLLPEMQRSNLLEEVLCLKKLRLGKAEEALKMMPAVPARRTIKEAIKNLQHIGALDENETLTPLGWHLARLPVHPAAGKLLILGALFGCLDRAASVAAVWGFKDPFQLVIGKETEVNKAKRNFAIGEPSDHIAISEAVIQWEQCHHYDRRQFAYDNFLSHNTLQMLSDMKRQFAVNLRQMGFLRQPDIQSAWENRNTQNLSVFKAIVAASLYPNIATVKWLGEKSLNPYKPLRILAFTPEDGKVSMHPSSVMHSKRGHQSIQQPICLNVGANWLVYWLKQRSSDLFLLEVTCVYTLPLLFFSDLVFKKADNPDECHIAISSSLQVVCKKETAELLFQLRSLLDQVLASKISDSSFALSKKNSEFDEAVLGAVIDLITSEDEGTQYTSEGDGDNDFEAVNNETAME